MQPMKQCPNCKTVTNLAAASCLQCGRVFRSTAPGNPNQTQVFSAGSAAAAAPVRPSSDMAVLREIERQYKRLVGNSLFCIFVLGFCFVTLFVAGYQYSRLNELRLRVAEMGHDTLAWEEPLKSWSRRLALKYLAFWGVLIAFGVFITLGVEYTAERDRAERERIAVEEKIRADAESARRLSAMEANRAVSEEVERVRFRAEPPPPFTFQGRDGSIRSADEFPRGDKTTFSRGGGNSGFGRGVSPSLPKSGLYSGGNGSLRYSP